MDKTDIWMYTNVSVKQGNTDGELMFDFQLNELGRTPEEEAAVRNDLTTLFRHNLSSTKLELVFLTLQEFQYLTIQYGDFFANKDWKQDKNDIAMPEPRLNAYQHFCGISAGFSALDNQNGVRASNMLPSFNGSRIAIRKNGPYERSLLYFNKTVKRAKLDGENDVFVYRDIAVGDNLFLLVNIPTESSKMSVELLSGNPAIVFTVENRTIEAKVTVDSMYYYVATVSGDISARLRKSLGAYPIGYIAAVQKTNPLTKTPKNAGDDTMYYHQVRSPETQKSNYTIDLTCAGKQDDPQELPSVPPLIKKVGEETLAIGAPAAEKENAKPAPAIKRTAATANLPVSAPIASSKITRKTAPSATPPINPAT